MSKIFDYSKIAINDTFVGRDEELKRLSSDFFLLTNAAVLAPRGYGKSSLIHAAAQVAAHRDKDLRFCFVDLSNVRNEERFYELLCQGVLKAVSRNQEEVVENVKRLFSNVVPRISFDSSGDFTVDLDWSQARNNQDELLNLPVSAAGIMGVKLVVCVDEFHLISLFSDPDSLVDRIKTRWVVHEKVSYCISGIRLSFVDKFLKSSSAFYRYGDVMDLVPVRKVDMIRYMRDRFADNGKYLDDEMAGMIVDFSEGNSFYTIQLAHLSWLGTSVVCSDDVVEAAFENMVDQMDMVFRNITEGLTTQQLCYLHAVLAGETVISTSEVLHRHHITSATSATRSKAALMERGLVCNPGGKICLSDPVYAHWLKSRYFLKK